MRVHKPEAAVYLLLFALSSVVYFTISTMTTAPVEVFMPRWVPFMPILAIPYLLQVAGSYVLAMFVGDPARRRACFYAYFGSYSVTCLLWFFYPTIMHRPAVPPGWWNFPYSVMAGLDMPVNVLPAGHILMPVIIVWAFSIDRPRWLYWLVPAELLGALAIMTTWQHRPVDLVIGIVLSLGFGWVFGVGKKRADEPAVATVAA